MKVVFSQSLLQLLEIEFQVFLQIMLLLSKNLGIEVVSTLFECVYILKNDNDGYVSALITFQHHTNQWNSQLNHAI